MTILTTKLPKKLWAIALASILLPYFFYVVFPSESKWLATLFGLLSFGLVFSTVIFLHAVRRPPLKNKTVDWVVKILLFALAISIFVSKGIPSLTDSVYLMMGNKSLQFDGVITNRTTTYVSWITGTQFLTIEKESGEQIHLTSSFIFSHFKLNEAYTFTVLPFSKNLVEAEIVSDR